MVGRQVANKAATAYRERLRIYWITFCGQPTRGDTPAWIFLCGLQSFIVNGEHNNRIQRATTDILNNVLRTADKRWCSSLEFLYVVYSPSYWTASVRKLMDLDDSWNDPACRGTKWLIRACNLMNGVRTLKSRRQWWNGNVVLLHGEDIEHA
jgi:hypothetical protein